MSCFRFVKRYFDDVWDNLCIHKWRALACAFVAATGITVGIVLFNVFSFGWWYFNRIEYAKKLFDGGFSLFLSMLLWTAVFYVVLIICNMFRATRFLTYAVLFISCLYCGANSAAVVVCWSVWGILFILLVIVAEVLGYFLACFAVFCQYPECRSFSQTFCDLRPCLFVLIASFIVRIIGFFVILRLLTAVI